MTRHIKSALLKSILAVFLFILVYVFYNNEIIRENIEDIAFDTVEKIAVERTSTDTVSFPVLIFAFDDLYMQSEGLYDDYNRSAYGYLMPRDKIASYIESIDELVKDELEPENYPVALFIDYDMSFTMMPYGKIMSKEDDRLLSVLKKDRPYKILLPKTSYYNFIEHSRDPLIREKIREHQIIFVSVSLLRSSDDVVRRYESYKSFIKEKGEGTKEYLNVDIALWYLQHFGSVPSVAEVQKSFSKNDIVSNRILIKSYASYQKEDGCSAQQSYWTNLNKYSANCSLYEIPQEEFRNAIMMIGGTHSHNDDRFDVLNVMSPESFSGIDLHANALMTIEHLDGQLHRLSLLYSIIIVFIVFFAVSWLVSTVFSQLKIYNGEIEFIVQLFIVTTVLFGVSVYLLKIHSLWFNWFVALIMYEVIEIVGYITPIVKKIILRRKNA